MFKRKKVIVIEEETAAEAGANIIWGKPGLMRWIRVIGFIVFIFWLMSLCGSLQ